ncbi:MAG: protein kinase [Bryobacteraceae bacterium]
MNFWPKQRMQVERWKRIEELYQAALAEPPEKRTEFLTHACADHPSLQREVESLLNLASEAGSFLEHSPISSLANNTPALPSGYKLGNFEILEPIGRGGMGEVYLARDTRLKRDVAIKVLPSAFTGDTGRKTRLEREARILAALNHPRIATIYGVEAIDGGYALAMEYVPGPTLEDHITHDVIPLPEAIAIAIQIAGALEYAHERGVVHRDLKPANIKVTPDGEVKVLDFGLAKVDGPATGSIDGSNPGFILGTAAYMAPEQARGQAVDKRADIWAFGIIFHEMVIGRRPTQGEPLSDLDWPPAIGTMIRRCLEQDPKRRLRDIGDARIVMEEYLAEPQPETPRGKPAVRALLPWMISAAVALGLAVALWMLQYTAHRDQPLIRLDVDLGPDAVLDATNGASVVLSPDGKRLAFVSRGADGQTRLSARRLDQAEATPLAGTEGAVGPFFSPDGIWLGFFTETQSPFGGKLKKIRFDGGSVLTVSDAPGAAGASWDEDGTIIAPLHWDRGLSRVSAAGGQPTPVTTLNSGETSHRWPQILPGGKAVLFTSYDPSNGSFDGANIDVQSLADGRRTVLQHRASYGRYVPSGHLIFAHEGALFAAPMDVTRLELTGPAVTLLEDLEYLPVVGSTNLSSDGTGTLTYTKSRPQRNTVQWLDKSGKLQPLLAKPAGYAETRFSPDGRQLALGVWDHGRKSCWIYDLEAEATTRLAGSYVSFGLVWSPNGKRIALSSADGIYWTMADGSGEDERLTRGPGPAQYPYSFTSDGKRLAYAAYSKTTSWDIWTVPLEFDQTGRVKPGKPETFLRAPMGEAFPQFSPDGRWLAYISDESGVAEVYVRRFSAGGATGSRWPVSTGGGLFPVWSHDGRELFYRSFDNQIMVVSCSTRGEVFQASKPRVWSKTRIATVSFADRTFDMSPDGKRAAVVMPAPATDEEKARAHQVVFLLNMSDELRRKVRPGTKDTP